MSFKIKIKGEIQTGLTELSFRILSRLNFAMDKSGFLLAGNMKRLIQQGPARTGTPRPKRLSKKGKGGRASARGEPAKSDTGRLAGSIIVDNSGFLSTETGTNVDYAAILETTLERNFMQPTLDETEPEIQRLIDIAMRTAVT